jgi:predicted O-methyltransferase YrrM
MSNKSIQLDDQLYRYLLSVTLREPEILRQLREETASHPFGGMQISPEQGQFMALSMPPDGRLIALDLSAEYTQTAQRYWQLAGVAHKIELQLRPALDSLDKLICEGASGSFDLAFIDADKGNYSAYYERSLDLVRSGGLLLLDNVLWGGKVADPSVTDEDTCAIRDMNKKIHMDDRVSAVLLPVADGLTLVRKR